ncbi:hypothetical protein NPIL_151991 [Nephila pilipes]|uniref:Uncharacterized protein n=1 Tax=Nephila pilipes TaxID=299642 RepID=A0A8X6R2Q4_NEPPI|nr:hypothetical protein NPIL_151991 [Nephila pilipes]
MVCKASTELNRMLPYILADPVAVDVGLDRSLDNSMGVAKGMNYFLPGADRFSPSPIGRLFAGGPKMNVVPHYGHAVRFLLIV